MKKDTQSIYDLPQGDLQEEQPRRLRQKKKPRKWLWLTLIVLVVLGAVAAAVLWDANSFDGLRRSIIYARAEKDETGCAKLYYYENDATSRFAAIDGSLVTVAANQVRLLDERSQVLYQNSVRFLHPDLVSGGGVAVAYDIGGTALYALDSKGLRWQQETEGELLAVTVNPHGYVTAVYNKSGAKAAVTVWDSNGAAVFTFQSAQRFVMTAALGQDDRTLAAVTMGQENGKFQSFLVLYHTASDKMVVTTPVDGGVAYALETLQREFCAVTEQGLYLLDSGGELKASYSYGGQFLRRCVVGDGGWAALLLRLLQPAVPLADCLVETFSAIGTVGMSTGITRQLGALSRALLIFLMYCGRVGSLSFSLALFEKRSRPPVTQPTETLIIG